MANVAFRLASTLGLVLALLPSAGGRAEAGDPRAPQRAADRGVDYLVARADAMPPSWRLQVFGALEKRLPEGERQRRCHELAEKARTTPVVALPGQLEPNDLRWPRSIRPIILELVRTRESPEPLHIRLATLIAEHESKLFEKLNPTQRLVTLYQLEALGVPTRLEFADVVGEVHAQWQAEARQALLLDAEFMFAITHVPIIRSSYFERPVAKEGHAVEIEVLDAAAAQYAQAIPEPPIFLDVAAEVVIARRLFRLPESDDTRAIRRELVARQRENGSWGEPRFEGDLHATYVAVAALAAWPPAFDPMRPTQEANTP